VSHYTGELVEILLESHQNASARLLIPPEALPAHGQYLQAHQAGNPDEVLPISLFAAGPAEKQGSHLLLPVAGPLPAHWGPGTIVKLRGPLGKAFTLPRQLKRLALVALGASPGRLLPLIHLALKASIEIAIFCDPPSLLPVGAQHTAPGALPNLPLEVEQQPLSTLPEALAWADFLAMDIALEKLELLPTLLSRESSAKPRGQALVHAPMPCGGLAQCGVCAFATPKGERLACEHGPVFELASLL